MGARDEPPPHHAVIAARGMFGDGPSRRGALATAIVLVTVVAAPASAIAQPPTPSQLQSPPPAGAPAQRPVEPVDEDRPFIDALRREDPASADQFIALRNARQDAIAGVRRAEEQYAAAGPELRRVFLPQLLQARRAYAQTSLALLDFLDERDRRIAARYQEEIGRINAALDARKKNRADLEKMLKGD